MKALLTSDQGPASSLADLDALLASAHRYLDGTPEIDPRQVQVKVRTTMGMRVRSLELSW